MPMHLLPNSRLDIWKIKIAGVWAVILGAFRAFLRDSCPRFKATTRIAATNAARRPHLPR
eukprot:SAG11_NODE_2530_length_3250_cov_2.524913_5_plen_60_part_00